MTKRVLVAMALLLTASTTALAQRSGFGICEAPASAAADNPHWRLWPFGGGLVGAVVGTGVGLAAAAGAAGQVQTGCDPARDDVCGAAAYALLGGVPLGLVTGAIGGIVGVVIGYHLAVSGADEATADVATVDD